MRPIIVTLGRRNKGRTGPTCGAAAEETVAKRQAAKENVSISTPWTAPLMHRFFHADNLRGPRGINSRLVWPKRVEKAGGGHTYSEYVRLLWKYGGREVLYCAWNELDLF